MNKNIYILSFLIALGLGLLILLKTTENQDELNTSDPESVSNQAVTDINHTKLKIIIPGIGSIEYDSILEGVDLREYCEGLLPERYTDGNATPITINVYLKGDRIVYIGKNKGMYPSENLSQRVLRIFQNGEYSKHGSIIGSGGTTVITNQESWLSIDDAEKLAVLQKYLFEHGWDKENKEAELIPIYVKQGLDPAGGTIPKEFLNKRFQGFFSRTSNGRPNSETPYNDAKYPFEESYLRRYSVISLSQDAQGKWLMNGPGANKVLPEGSLEAVEKYKYGFEDRQKSSIKSR